MAPAVRRRQLSARPLGRRHTLDIQSVAYKKNILGIGVGDQIQTIFRNFGATLQKSKAQYLGAPKLKM